MTSRSGGGDVTGMMIAGIVREGPKIFLEVKSFSHRDGLQRAGTVEFVQVTAVHGEVETDPSAWKPHGEIGSLKPRDGGARLELLTYGPGDVWTTVWEIECAAMLTSTRVVLKPTLRSVFHWISTQWVFWLAAFVIIIVLLMRLSGRS